MINVSSLPTFLWVRPAFLPHEGSKERLRGRLTGVWPFTVKPLLNGHPLLSGKLSIYRNLLPIFTVNVTSIQWSPLLGERSQRLDFPIG